MNAATGNAAKKWANLNANKRSLMDETAVKSYQADVARGSDAPHTCPARA